MRWYGDRDLGYQARRMVPFIERRDMLLGLFVALLALAAVPLLLCVIPPLVDYPNHLARVGLLARLGDDATLRQFYVPAWHAIPDLAIDVAVPLLLRILPLLAAGRLFVFAILLLLAGGPVLAHRALTGRWSVWPCLAFLLLYNRLLLWGLLNYLFGLGLAFCAFAAMVALRERGVAVRLAVGAVAALAVWFAHLMAFGVYGLLILGYALARARRMPWRAGAARVAIAVLPLALPAALMLAAGAGAGGGPVVFSQPGRKLDLLFSVFDLYHRPLDVACFVLAVAALGLAYTRRWIALASGMGLPLALLALAYLALPSEMMGATGIDRRMPLALALALCAGGTWAVPRPRLERAFLVGAAVMFLARLATVATSWAASDRDYRPILAAFAQIPPGSRIAVAYPPEAVNVSATPLVHLPVLAAALRDAFVPTLFALPSQQPIALTPDYRALAAATSPDRLWHAYVNGVPLDGEQRAVLGHYGYLAFAAAGPFALTGPRGLVPVFVAPRFALYRLGRVGGG